MIFDLSLGTNEFLLFVVILYIWLGWIIFFIDLDLYGFWLFIVVFCVDKLSSFLILLEGWVLLVFKFIGRLIVGERFRFLLFVSLSFLVFNWFKYNMFRIWRRKKISWCNIAIFIWLKNIWDDNNRE